MRRRSLFAAPLALLVPFGRGDGRAQAASGAVAAEPPEPSARFVSWPILTASGNELPSLSGHTDTVPDIVGRIDGRNGLVIFTEGNHFPALLGGDVIGPFRAWAKAEPRFADLDLGEIAVVTLPQPIIVAILRRGGLKLGNAVIEVSTSSGFYPDVVMAGAEPLHELRRDGIVRSDARLFARNKGLGLVVRKGNPLGIAAVGDLAKPGVKIVMASASEPGARAQYRRALDALIGEGATSELLAHEVVTFDGRLGIQHRDVLEALAKNHANVGIIVNHLAQYYANTFPTLAEAVEVLEAERFSSTIAFTTVSNPLRGRATVAFEEFFFGIARDLYPRYGFATMSPEEFGMTLPLGAGSRG
jgi:hypothetical protein